MKSPTKTKKTNMESEKSHGNALYQDNKVLNFNEDPALKGAKRYTPPKRNNLEMKFQNEETELHNLKGSPFGVYREKEEWHLLLGNKEIDRDTDREKMLKRWERPTWDNITKLVLGAIEVNEEYKTNNK